MRSKRRPSEVALAVVMVIVPKPKILPIKGTLKCDVWIFLIGQSILDLDRTPDW